MITAADKARFLMRYLHHSLAQLHRLPARVSLSYSRSMSCDAVKFPEPPTGYEAHQESTTQILIKSTGRNVHQPSEAFINPVQEYNRDLSISVIRAWSKLRNHELEARSIHKKNKRSAPSKNNCGPNKKVKTREADDAPTDVASGQNNHALDAKVDAPDASTDLASGTVQLPPTHPVQNTTQNDSVPNLLPDEKSADTKHNATQSKFIPQKFSALEALSATGLRAIRYAKEIPSLKWIVANDLSPSAVNLIKMNITHNGLQDPTGPNTEGKVRVTQGDACDLMYAHRQVSKQFDVVDLDPYGSAAPFMDAAVQCVKDGGLLCVTCTDLAVLAGHAYPEKCFSNYGGSSMRAEYSHEYALRQVIHGLASSAGRYGKSIQPILSLSIDFYVRIFVRVYNSPAQVKKLITNTALVYVCSGCSAYHFQPLGRSSAKPTKSGTHQHESFHNAPGPPVSSGSQCEECGGKFHVAGPLWSGPLHDQEFAQKVLDDVDEFGTGLKTSERIKGMVQIAKTEIPDSPFYFTPTKLSGLFKCTSPSLTTVGSAIMNAGYQISRSHCSPGSIKTNAPRRFLYDLMRKWVDFNRGKKKDTENLGQPEPDGNKMDEVEQEVDPDQKPEPVEVEQGRPDQKSVKQHLPPSAVLLSKPTEYEVDLEYNKNVEKSLIINLKIVRYQSNPLPNWGPKSKALKK